MTDRRQPAPFARQGGSVADDVVRHLQRLIVTGVLAPGERLAPERSLAVELGVSRNALREALLRLELLGLLDRQQGRGTRVSTSLPLMATFTAHLEHDAAQFHDSAELRIVVEPQIARLAAGRIEADELDALTSLLQQSATTRDADESVRLDVAFHVAVARATRNALLASLSELTVAWTVEARVYSHLEDHGRQLSYAGHTRILRALQARDGDAAEAAMRVHLDEIAEVIEEARDSGA
ncbi:FadR/GntR family transcriptional regulator [Microbacterium sp. LWH3-1.2]|uniref:FadR/GntR family transcriptional regulator n=1 Tax=Microbacterium sp. LWH3-1.2 TaxID=3135256 RepID=UPI00341B73F1